MISNFEGKTAVLTGAGSGFGLACARLGARLGMKLVLVDVQRDALDAAVAELSSSGGVVVAHCVDVSKAEQMQSLADAVFRQLGAPHLVFNTAGVGSGGLVWENSLADWQWVLGVNLWGVIHGVRLFTPMMLQAAQQDPRYQGHIVNTASMAGLLTPPNMGGLQREQTRRGGTDRNLVPRPAPGDGPGQCQCGVPVLCAHGDWRQPTQSPQR